MENIRWLLVIRDAVIIYFLTFIGGFAVAAATYDPTERLMGHIVVGSIVQLIGFSFSAIFTKQGRNKHVFVVAFVFWVANLVVGLFCGYPIIILFASIISIIGLAAISLGIAALVSSPTGGDSTDVKNESAKHICQQANEALLKRDYAGAVKLYELAEKKGVLSEKERKFKKMAKARLSVNV